MLILIVLPRLRVHCVGSLASSFGRSPSNPSDRPPLPLPPRLPLAPPSPVPLPPPPSLRPSRPAEFTVSRPRCDQVSPEPLRADRSTPFALALAHRVCSTRSRQTASRPRLTMRCRPTTLFPTCKCRRSRRHPLPPPRTLPRPPLLPFPTPYLPLPHRHQPLPTQ
jgi:hypothetical protein